MYWYVYIQYVIMLKNFLNSIHLLVAFAYAGFGTTAYAANIDPDISPLFKWAIDTLVTNISDVSSPRYLTKNTSMLWTSSGPAHARLYLGSGRCDIVINSDAESDPFILALMNATGWSKQKAALFVIGHEQQHCEDLARMNKILHGKITPQSNLVMSAVVPSTDLVNWMTKQESPWLAYVNRRYDQKFLRIGEASGDIAGLLLVNKVYGITSDQVRRLAAFRSDASSEDYDETHNTTQWLIGFARMLELKNDYFPGVDASVLKTMSNEDVVILHYTLLSKIRVRSFDFGSR